jgi:hypothetical protein
MSAPVPPRVLAAVADHRVVDEFVVTDADALVVFAEIFASAVDDEPAAA